MSSNEVIPPTHALLSTRLFINKTCETDASMTMSALTSTPTRAQSSQPPTSSDQIDHHGGRSSPPSSPPDQFPWETAKEQGGIAEDAPKEVTNVFSILGKRKPLNATTDNVRPAKKSARTSTPRQDSNGLTQMQMSLGQTVQKKCKTCGMEYVASSAEDRKLHDEYHAQNREGFDVGKDFVAKTAQVRKEHGLFKGVREGDAIVYLDCRDPWQRRRKGQEVLEIVQRELGAVPIDEKHIWSVERACESGMEEPVFKAYLYIRGTKAVGFLLVQDIHEAYEAVPPDIPPARAHSATSTPEPSTTKNGGQGVSALAKLKARKQHEADAKKALEEEMAMASAQPLKLSSAKHPAIMGISRIWTSSTHRGQGIAERLINTAINRHNAVINDATVKAGGQCAHSRSIKRKQDIAFSQPTEAGATLARKWFGRAYGWRVYVD